MKSIYHKLLTRVADAGTQYIVISAADKMVKPRHAFPSLIYYFLKFCSVEN